MTRPVLIDLFCGAGGAAMGYHNAGFQVIGVDNQPQPNYPFEFHQADALTYPLTGADAVHASPPCQAHVKGLAAANKAQGRGLNHKNLIEPTRARLQAAGVPYVIENVPGAPLHNPVTLCGSSFGLAVRRHRLFETNFPVMTFPCAHHLQTNPRYWTGWTPGGERRLSTVVQVYGNSGGTNEWPAAMDIHWMTTSELAQAIPPAYTRHIGEYLLAAVTAKEAA